VSQPREKQAERPREKRAEKLAAMRREMVSVLATVKVEGSPEVKPKD